MINRTFYTPQISLPEEIRFADCCPIVYTTDFQLSRAYLIQNYVPRSTWEWFNKGPIPPPIYIDTNLNGNIANYTIYFNNFGGSQCPSFNCNLQCTNQSVILATGGTNTNTGTFCINGERPIYNFSIEFSNTENREAYPANFSFTFIDGLSNTNVLNVDSISYIKPINPTLALDTKIGGEIIIYVGIPYLTKSFVSLDTTKINGYIIEKAYGPNKTNKRTFTGPNPLSQDNESSLHNNLFIDSDIVSNEDISYRVLFKNIHNEQTQWSNWTSIRT